MALGPTATDDLPELALGQTVLFVRGAGTGNDAYDPVTKETYRMVRTEHLLAVLT